MFDKNKDIMVRNYNPYVITVNTRLQDFTFPAAERGSYTALPLTWDEILQINNGSKIFKDGFLLFPEEDEEEIYKSLRILHPENILRNEQIEEIILHPTKEGVEKLISIDDDANFDRARGIYTYLRNNGYDISNRIDAIMEMRYAELKNNKKTSSIVISDKIVTNDSERIKELESKLSEMDALKEKLAALEKLLANTNPETKEDASGEKKAEAATEEAVAKPAPKKRTSSTGSKKAK